MSDANSNETEDRPSWLERGGALVIALLAAGVASLAYLINFGLTPSDKQDVWGQFGDFIGGLLNPLVALFALYMLGAALRVQRRELKDTRAELEGTRRVADEQRRVMQRQLFESQFFAALSALTAALDRARANRAFTYLAKLVNDAGLGRMYSSTNPLNAKNFLNEVIRLSNDQREFVAPIVALVKVAANAISRNAQNFSTVDDNEMWHYATALRALIHDAEACVLLADMQADFALMKSPPPLAIAVDKFHLIAGITPVFMQTLWKAHAKEDTVILYLVSNFSDQLDLATGDFIQ